MTSRIPPLLKPYTHLPTGGAGNSLILLTSLLGASTNWLVLRFIHDALLSCQRRPKPSEPSEPCVVVVLVSFMRDYEFWKDGARRLGLDLPHLTHQGLFAFIDGLTDLFASDESTTTSRSTRQDTGNDDAQQCILNEPTTERVRGDILAQIEALKAGGPGGEEERRVVLVLDQPDVLLAVTEEDIGAGGMMGMIMDLRQHVYSMIVTLAADAPLIQSPTTPLEIQHSTLLVMLAHLAGYVMSLRLLDTGTARDISGVMRVTLGPDDMGGRRADVEEKELLYFVGADGGVKVFERGTEGHS